MRQCGACHRHGIQKISLLRFPYLCGVLAVTAAVSFVTDAVLFGEEELEAVGAPSTTSLGTFLLFFYLVSFINSRNVDAADRNLHGPSTPTYRGSLATNQT